MLFGKGMRFATSPFLTLRVVCGRYGGDKVFLMKNCLLVGVLLLILPMAGLAGDCTGSLPAGNWLQSINLNNRMVCVRNADDTGWENQEHHQVGGDLVEYAQGPDDPVDPTRKIGTWTIVEALPNNANQVVTIRYDYDGGPSYTFDIYRNQADPPNERRIAFCETGTGTGLVALGVRQVRVTSPTACVP